MTARKAKVDFIDSKFGKSSVTIGAQSVEDIEKQLEKIANEPQILAISWLS